MTTFERIVEIEPAYDGKQMTPPRNCGIGSAVLRVILKDPLTKQAVQFVTSLGWYKVGSHLLPPNSLTSRYWRSHSGFRETVAETSDPMPYDLGYHSATPRYEGQPQMQSNCPVTGGECYYDGSSLNAYDAWKVLIEGGDKALWSYLEEYYKSVFNKEAPEDAETD